MSTQMARSAAPTSKPTLRKLGADLRWLLEKSGLDPERAMVTIGVPDAAAHMLLLETFAKEFDKTVMYPVSAQILSVHGVYIHVVVNSHLDKMVRPPEPA